MRLLTPCLAMIVLSVLASASSQRAQAFPPPGQAEIFAGSGAPEGQTATIAPLQPRDIAVIGTDVYVADGFTCKIRRISAGQVFTFAGSGSCTYSGDGGSALAAGMNPTRLAVSPSGELYFSDGCRIRRIASSVVTTVVGTGVCGFAGDGGAPASAQINGAGGIAFTAAGEMLFTDSCRVRKVGFFITTIAGNSFCGFGGDGGPASAAFFHSPAGLTVASSGDVYIADNSNCSIRKISGGTITSVAGVYRPCDHTGDGGASTSAPLRYPTDVAFDAAGDLHTSTECKVRVLAGGIINAEAFTGVCSGNAGDGGSALAATIANGQSRIEFLGSDLLVVDLCNVRIVSGGVISNFAGTPHSPFNSSNCGAGGDGGPPVDASFALPKSVHVDGSGVVYVNDIGCRIQKITPTLITTMYTEPGCGMGAMDIAPNGDLYSLRSGRVQRLSGGVWIDDVHTGQLFTNSSPRDLTVDPSTGDVYVASVSCSIVKVSGGVVTAFAGLSFTCANSGDGGSPLAARFKDIQTLEAGPTGELFVSSYGYGCGIRKISGGIVSTVAAEGAGPCGDMAIDGGGLYVISDCAIYRVNTGGQKYALAANVCPAGYGPADVPATLDLDASGNLYVSQSRITYPSIRNRNIWVVAADGDGDADGVTDASDNCAAIANPLQENNDRNFIDNPGAVPDDLTRTNSDNIGDPCDTDDDNDGLSDTDEGSLPAAACPAALAPTSQTSSDSDGDNYLDGAECALGTNPGSAASKPATMACGPAGDTDNDGLSNRIEYCFYNSNPANANTDGDACSDGKEVASMDGDYYVYSSDQGLMASARPPNPYVANFDPNKDGVINSGDQGFQASKFGPCP